MSLPELVKVSKVVVTAVVLIPDNGEKVGENEEDF
jgi:hypothetical protein